MNKYEELLTKFKLDPEIGRQCIEFVTGDGKIPPGISDVIDNSKECQRFIEEAISLRFLPLQEAVAALKRGD